MIDLLANSQLIANYFSVKSKYWRALNDKKLWNTPLLVNNTYY